MEYGIVYLKHELLGEWVSHENTSNKWDIQLEYHGRALYNYVIPRHCPVSNGEGLATSL